MGPGTRPTAEGIEGVSERCEFVYNLISIVPRKQNGA